MATFQFREHTIYYESYGEGKPLIILNGIMMSTVSWQSFVKSFSQYNRLILVDMLDQGNSSKLVGKTYDQSLQVEVIKALVDHLHLEKIFLFGISYGGEVAMRFALEYQQRVERLLLFNTTAKTSLWLKEIGYAWNKAAADGEAYYSTTIPTIYSPQFFTKNAAWMEQRKSILIPLFSNPAFSEAMIRLTNSAEYHDVAQDIHKILVPTLVVGCENDYITPLAEQRFLADQIPNAQLVVIPDSGHASMYEKPYLFTSLVLGYVLADHVTFKIG
jgi:pimeloyl-ACP methyl ester carboxylesterase